MSACTDMHQMEIVCKHVHIIISQMLYRSIQWFCCYGALRISKLMTDKSSFTKTTAEWLMALLHPCSSTPLVFPGPIEQFHSNWPFQYRSFVKRFYQVTLGWHQVALQFVQYNGLHSDSAIKHLSLTWNWEESTLHQHACLWMSSQNQRATTKPLTY